MASAVAFAKSKFAFGPFVVDSERRTLSRDDAFVPLGTRAMDLLCVLLAARGQLVTKNELMAHVWPGKPVDENNLHVQISTLRKALGEDSGETRYVVTVPGRGYRFALERAQQVIPAVQSAAARGRGGTMPQSHGAGSFPPLPDRPSIAVLPFANTDRDPERDYFVDRVVEEITAVLSRRRWLRVIARNATVAYRGREVDVKQVGRELGVRYLLEGGMRTTGERLRIAGQLIDASTGIQLWADRFEAARADAGEPEDELSASIARAVILQVEQAEIDRAKRVPAENLTAYDYYLRGLACLHQENREATGEALRLFRKAIRLDPDYASAYGMAGWCYCRRKEQGWAGPRDAIEAGELAWRAVELGREDAVALSMSGRTLLYVTREIEAGAAFLDRALALNPDLPMAWAGSGWARARLGEPDLAIEHVGRAMRLSPLDPLMHNMQSAMGFAHFFAGRYDEAGFWSNKVLKEAPHSGHGLRVAAASHALAGRLGEAGEMMERLRKICPGMRIANLNQQSPLRRPEDQARWAEGLRLAGLPE